MLAISTGCNLLATAFAAAICYVATCWIFKARARDDGLCGERRQAVSLKLFEWLMLLVAGMLCGLLTLLF